MVLPTPVGWLRHAEKQEGTTAADAPVDGVQGVFFGQKGKFQGALGEAVAEDLVEADGTLVDQNQFC